MVSLTISANYNTSPELNPALDKHSIAMSDRVAYEFTYVGELK